MYAAILFAHALAGTVVLAGAAVAIATRLFGLPHRAHIWSGNAFTLGIAGIAATGLLIIVYTPSAFLVCLAVFLLYLSTMGWRHAEARGGIGGPLDTVLALVFLSGFLFMLAYGAWEAFLNGNQGGYVLLVFGTIGLLQAGADVRYVLGAAPTGTARIAAHLTRMLGGTIGALTAFLLIQFETSSLWVWLGPTAVLTPLLIFWSRKVKSDWLPRRAPKPIKN